MSYEYISYKTLTHLHVFLIVFGSNSTNHLDTFLLTSYKIYLE